MSDLIIAERLEKEIAVLRINRPEVYNALNFDTLQAMEQHLDGLQKEEIRVLIITGTGKSFSSGADLKEIKTFDPETVRDFSLQGNKAFAKIEGFPCPVIAVINGYALGGGCELACACDFRYASETAKLGQPESKIGLITGWGGTFRLSRLVGIARAKEIILTGKLLSAREALDLGLVNGVVPDSELLNRAVDLAREISKNAPIAIRLSKKMLNRYGGDLQSMIDEESSALSFCAASQDRTEGINAFLEKREPVFRNK